MALSRRRIALVALAAGMGASACHRTIDKTLYLPTERANLVLQLQYPTGVSCDDVQTWLLRVDTAGGPAWTYTFLFDAAHQIYGCGGTGALCNPAPTAPYPMNLLGAKKVELEGLTVAPATWAATTSTSDGVQVVCRGIADAAVIPGSIAIASVTPTPAPQPTAIPVDVTVHLQVMRVGASNTVFGTLPPDRLWAAAASLSSARFGFDDGQGRILLAGGAPDESAANPTAAIYSFSPQTLTFSSAGTLSSARAGLTATATLFGGLPAVVFAGGGGGANGSVPSTDVDVVFADGTIHPMALPVARSYHSAVYLDGGGAPVIAIAGGAHLVGGTPFAQWTSPGDSTLEVIVPAGSASTLCTTDGTTCGLAPSTGARGLAVAERISGVPDSLFLGGGTGANATWETAPSSTLTPGGALTLTGALPYIASASAVIDSAGNPDLDGKPVMFGGSSGDDPFSNASVSTVSQYRGASVALLATTMNPKRAFLTATALRDHTILLAGGMNTTNGTNHPATGALERFRPQFVAAGNTQTGVVEPLPGAPALVEARFAHTATRIEGSRTWLDGAVLIAGGTQSASKLPELFVPSYKCNAAGQPVSEAVTSTGVPLGIDPGSNPALPQPCDRGRVKEPITDPLSGASFLP